MSSTVYSPARMAELEAQRKSHMKTARTLIDNANASGRDLTTTEAEAVEASVAAVKADEPERIEQHKAMVKTIMDLGTSDADYADDSTAPRYMSLRRSGTKARLATRASNGLLGKAYNDGANPLVSIEMDPTPYLMGRPATSLLEILPSVVRAPVFRFMRQTTRTNLAAPVAVGGLKPTSKYGLTAVDGRLRVVAHLSEAVDVFALKDGPNLMAFIGGEMLAGLHDAVEAQIVSGTGVGENLTGLGATAGIQTQAYTTSAILTARNAITKVELLGFSPYYFVVHPTDWAAIETAQLTAGAYVLNAEGGAAGAGLPVDAALRRLWGVPVTVSTAVAAGTAFLISSDCVQVATDGVIGQEWSTSMAEDFSRNASRCRVESRFDLMVSRPSGVVKIALTGA